MGLGVVVGAMTMGQIIFELACIMLLLLLIEVVISLGESLFTLAMPIIIMELALIYRIWTF